MSKRERMTLTTADIATVAVGETAEPAIDEAPAVEAPPPPPPPPAEKRTVEHWATAKGMLPQLFPGEAKAMPRGLGADRMGGVSLALGRLRGPRGNPNFWKFHAAKAGSQWPEGFEITEADFDAAVKLASEDHQLT